MGYLDNKLEGRSERASFSLGSMGITVFSGACSTFLAGFWLIFVRMNFFLKMGAVMMSTIFFSITWALFYFNAVMFEFGPRYMEYQVVPEEYINMICGGGEKRAKDD